jgi:D-glycero-alpha-D-manno-heptose-7-phosphate kinase
MSKSHFLKRSHTRVDLCGGTLDLWPISTLIDGSKTFNASLSCMTEVSFKPKENTLLISVESPDFNESFSFNNYEDFFDAEDSKLSLIQESLKVFKDHFSDLNFFGEWHLKSDSPAGSGLGGSSSLLVSLLKVLFEFCEYKVNEEEIVTCAKNIETRVLKKPAGVQDYYPAVEAGLSCISFEIFGTKRRLLDKTLLDFLNDHIILLDSEIKHHSGMNNWEIFKNLIDEDDSVKRALVELSEIANDFELILEARDLSGLKKLFDKELSARKRVSNTYFNKELEDYCNGLAALSGVLSYKVCGAGGGGCLMVLCQSSEKSALRERLKENSFKVLDFEIVS